MEAVAGGAFQNFLWSLPQNLQENTFAGISF